MFIKIAEPEVTVGGSFFVYGLVVSWVSRGVDSIHDVDIDDRDDD